MEKSKMNNDCNIVFEAKDFLEYEMKYFDKKARKIAHIVYNNPELLNLLSEFLLTFIDNIDFDSRYKKWKKELPEFHLLYGQEVLDNFLDELYSSFKSIKSHHLDKFRGIIFEYLLEIYYKSLYKGDRNKICFGCIVKINGENIIYNCDEDTSKNRKTVDIAAYNIDDSRFYELKVGPQGFDRHVIAYLNILKHELNKNEISKEIIVGCMTLKSKNALKIRLKADKLNFSELELNGLKEIKNMLI